ncbi:MAG: lipoate--protein ligase family protein [Calditrichia bacterium]
MDNFEITGWYLWPCAPRSGAFNMAADHYLARQSGKLLDRPLLRFYTWQPWCISLGYHQKETELNLSRCREENIDVVRRPTGGRAILHAEELTYSVIYPFHHLEISDFYRLVHQPFVDALQPLGVPACFQEVQPDLRGLQRSDSGSACFAGSARHEVEAQGRKLIGSAQRVYEKAILQHGSLLLGPQHEQLADFLNLPPDKAEAVRRHIRQHTAHVRQYCPQATAGKLADRVRIKFEERFGIRFERFIPVIKFETG